MKVLFWTVVLAVLAVSLALYAIVINLMVQRMDITVYEAIAILFVVHAIAASRSSVK